MIVPELSAAVLAGGRSRRMGTDKASISVAGATLLDRTLQTLRQVSDDVLVVGRSTGAIEPGVRAFEDDWHDAGPLGGIGTALRHVRHAYALCIACDMPLLTADVLVAMGREARDYDVLVPAIGNGPAERPRMHPLHAIYSTTCLPAIERRIATGQLQLVGLLEELRVRILDATWFERFGGTASLINVNTQAELNSALRLLEPAMPEREGRD